MSGPFNSVTKLQAALELRRGGKVVVWGYTPSHSTLRLRITHPRLAGNLHLACVACHRVAFECGYADSDVRLEVLGEPHLPIYRLIDGDRLLVECGVIEGEYNVPPLFDAG